MNITDVRVKLLKKDEGKLKAVASIIIDGVFVVHDIKVIEGGEGCFIVMPSRKDPTANTAILPIPSAPKSASRSKR